MELPQPGHSQVPEVPPRARPSQIETDFVEASLIARVVRRLHSNTIGSAEDDGSCPRPKLSTANSSVTALQFRAGSSEWCLDVSKDFLEMAEYIRLPPEPNMRRLTSWESEIFRIAREAGVPRFYQVDHERDPMPFSTWVLECAWDMARSLEKSSKVLRYMSEHGPGSHQSPELPPTARNEYIVETQAAGNSTRPDQIQTVVEPHSMYTDVSQRHPPPYNPPTLMMTFQCDVQGTSDQEAASQQAHRLIGWQS
ncbi:hypothetical protein M231_07936 [Tremella mesenterica]|uniref:Uncharacterized protein n=2 Tax=Tremella mesenterica TaxID=5217 RepID=A0A4Q1BF94_TREME|nr:hypothetical protein M231_07936 [Tremella mesenterica]